MSTKQQFSVILQLLIALVAAASAIALASVDGIAAVICAVGAFVFGRSAMKGLPEPEPARAPIRKATAQPQNEIEAPPSRSRRCNAHARIKYIDREGAFTVRDVRVTHCLVGDHGLLHGHCNRAGGSRTFMIDRIQECIDLETGEVVTDVRKWIRGKRIV